MNTKTIDIAKARDDARAAAGEAVKLSEEVIAPLLAGKGPDVQGATLANLLAMWLCGHHPPEVRGLMLQMHMGQVLELVKLEQMKRGE